MSCKLSQSSLVDEHFPTLSFVESHSPSMMKSIYILLFFLNSFFVAVFGFFAVLYPITIDCQISYPCPFKKVFILIFHISYFRPFWPLNIGAPFSVHSMIYLPVVILFLEGPCLIPIVGILRGGRGNLVLALLLLSIPICILLTLWVVYHWFIINNQYISAS